MKRPIIGKNFKIVNMESRHPFIDGILYVIVIESHNQSFNKKSFSY